MVSGLILSYNNDPTFHSLPYHIARELKNYHVLAIRHLFGCFHNKQNGVILNEDHGMDFPLQIVLFLSTFKSDTLNEDPVLVITAEDNVGLWKQYISDYTEFRVGELSDYDEESVETRGLIILGSDVEFKKAVHLKDSQYFMVVIEGLEKVITMRAMKGLQGVFHIGLTHRNFYKEIDLKLMWQMFKWAEPGAIGKFNDFSEEYNDCMLRMIEPFQEIWFRLTWNFSDTFEKPPVEELDLNTTKQKSTEKRRSSTKKRKSDEYKAPTTKKRRSNETGKNSASSSKKQHSNFQKENSNTSVSVEEQKSSIKSTENGSLNCTLNSSRGEKVVRVDSSPNSPKKDNASGSDSPRKSLKRKSLDQTCRGIEYPEIVINTKEDSIKISPKKEDSFCNTLKCSPRKKKRCDFDSTPDTPRSVIDLFEEYYKRNVDTPDTVDDNANTSKDPVNDSGELSANDFSLSLDSSPKTKTSNESSPNDFSSSLDFSPKSQLAINHSESSDADLLLPKRKSPNFEDNLYNKDLQSHEPSNGIKEEVDISTLKRNTSSLLQPVAGSSREPCQENFQINKALPVKNTGNSQIPCQSNVSELYNNKPSTSTKNIESFSINKNNIDPKRKPLNSNNKKKGKSFGKHKSAHALMKMITDEAVIEEFSSDFFESNQETKKFLRKTKSEANLTPKTKIIDKHVLDEFAKDFPINPLPGRMSFILRNVSNFLGGDENKAGPSTSDTPVVEQSPENIWSLFRKNNDPKPKTPVEANITIQEDVEIDDNSIINSIVEGAGSVTSSIRSVYSQETQIINREPDCLNCSGLDGKVVEFCIKCNKTISKEDKSTQSDFDEMPGVAGNGGDDIFAIFNNCDNGEVAVGGSVSERRNVGDNGGEGRVSLVNFFGEGKKTTGKYSREEVLSSIFDDDEEDRRSTSLFNEDNDDDFNDLELWSSSIGEERSKRIKSEILQSLFGE